MSKNLSRVTAKIFAGEAPLNAVGQFGSALNGTKVNTTDIATIQGLEAYEQGWSSAVVTNRNYPTLEETNGVLKAMSYQTAYNMQKGVAEWDEGTTYFSGDICKGVATGILYTSRSDNNIGNPVTDTTYWREYQGSASSIPATNYIAEINGSASFSNNTVTLPDMTLYIPNGRSGNGTLDNIVENVASKTYTVSGNGTYTLLYNNSNQDLLLAPNYETRLEELPETGNYDDVAYLLDNKMYVVESTNPNYVESDGVTVSSDGIVSNLGTLSAQIATAFPSLPVLNLNFTTGNDVTTAQSLFSIPYAKGNISNGNLDIAIYSLAYSVNYFSQVYSGAYTLTNQAITYSYLINDSTYYTKTPIQVGISVYENASFDTIYGTVTSLENGNIVISNITTAYDGAFSLVSNGDYYTYTLGATNYYTSEALATGVSVYTDTALSELFGIVTSIEGNTVLIQNTTEVYNGVYSDTSTRVYTYTLGENTLYSSGVLIPGLTIYINSDLTVPYGVVENITTQNVVIHSTQSQPGYVAKSGSGAVPSNNPIYSDVNLQSEITTSTGANATYTGESSLSQVGTLTYELNTSTNYSGTLSFNGTAYTLVLNNTSTSLLSSRTPYVEQSPAIVFGGSNGFLGTINLSGTSVDSVWTWNGYNTVSPDWTVEQLCKIGSITLANNEVTALDLDNVIELVKMSDLDNLNISASGGSGSLIMGQPVILDRILTYEDKESAFLALQGTYAYKDGVKGVRYGYPDFYKKCLEEKSEATADTVSLGGSNITIYTNPNGHQFYDIADKSIVDSFYNTYGVALYYGIDETNERIFLPRNRWFIQLTDNPEDVNKYQEAGLPNATGDIDAHTSGGTGGVFEGGNGVFSPSGFSTVGASPAANVNRYNKINFDLSNSNPIYGNNDTVQPPAGKQLLYYVVGSATEVTHLTTTIPEGEVIEQVYKNKADITDLRDLSNLTEVGNKVIDGEFVVTPIVLSAATTKGFYTIDLTKYIPDDGYIYEIFINGWIQAPSSGQGAVALTTDMMYDVLFLQTTNGQFIRGCTTLFTKNKELQYEVGTALQNSGLYLKGYRRVGTNK